MIYISILTEYNEVEVMQAIKNEYLNKGFKKGTTDAILNAMKNTNQTFDSVCDMLGISEQDKKIYAKMIL